MLASYYRDVGVIQTQIQLEPETYEEMKRQATTNAMEHFRVGTQKHRRKAAAAKSDR